MLVAGRICKTTLVQIYLVLTRRLRVEKLFHLLPQIASATWDLDAVSMGVFNKALENIAFLRAQSGGSMSRLNFAADSIASYTANMRAAVGRIEDVDIAQESSNLAKYSILSQAAAAMVAQANTTNDVALMLLR